MTKRNNHDSYFKTSLTKPEISKSFLNRVLPDKVKDMLDLTTIKKEPNDFIDENLQSKYSDVVLSVKTKSNDDALIFALLEHQSTSDYWMALRLRKYTTLIHEQYLKENKKAKKLPLIFSVIIYNGKAKYNAPESYWDLFDNPHLAKELTDKAQLYNLHSMLDSQIIKNSLDDPILYSMKHIHDVDLINAIDKFISILINNNPPEHLFDFVMRVTLCYTSYKLQPDDNDKLKEVIYSKIGQDKGENVMMSLAESYIHEGELRGIEKGIEKGREEGMLKTALNMLKEKADIEFVQRVTGLSNDQLLKLKSQL